MRVNTRTRINRVVMLVLVATIWAAGVPRPTMAADATQSLATLDLRIDTAKLQTLWSEAIKLLDKRDKPNFDAALLKLKEVEVQRMKSGFKNLPDHSAVLIQYAAELKQQRRIADAVTLMQSARLLSPDMASVYFALAKLRFAQNKADLYGVGQEFLRGVIAYWKDVNTIATYANNVLAVLLVSGFAAGAVFILFSFIYYQRAIFFYVKERIPLPLPLPMFNILGWIVVGVVTLICGVFWGLLLLAAMLIWAIDAAAKPMLQGFFLFGSVLAALLLGISITFTVFDGEYFQALRAIAYGDYSPQTVKVLQQHVKEHPDDGYALFGLAYIASHTGHPQEALATYQNMPGTYPGGAAVQNNIGNLYHAEFRKTKKPEVYDKAEEAYRTAMFIAPRLFEPRYNSGQMILIEFSNNQAAEEQMLAARKISQERFSRYSGYLESGVFTVDASISTGTLLQKLSEASVIKAGSELAQTLWQSGSRFGNPWYFSGICLVLLILAEVTAPKKGQPKKVSYCQMCGDAFAVKSRKKKGEEESGNYCTQCAYIFKKKTTVKPEKRAQKVQQIQIRQGLRGLIAKIGSVCLPGGGQVYYGYLLKGVLLSFGFFLGAATLLLKLVMVVLLPIDGQRGPSVITIGISVILAGGAYLLNLYDISKLSPKNQ